jgi:hypothetical protein
VSDWLEKLEQGAVICRVLKDDEPAEVFTPTDADQLWALVLIHDLGETARGYFYLEYQLFVESGQTLARYECQACSTIEKFGRAIQFKETFIVEFETLSTAKR